MMKLFDKFLKKLNTNRNTFVTYILTLITIYLCVDRLVEMLILIFTGVSVNYWNPIEYTLALACPCFAFLFSGSSSFADSKNTKVTLFYLYVIGLYIIAVSMFTQWLNFIGWTLFLSVPNYVGIISEFSDLVKPAFTALAIYLPLVTIMPFIKWIVLNVNDSTEMIRSIWDYRGISLSDTKKGHGQYTCDINLFPDDETGKMVTFPELRRFQPTLVCGGSGSGKTALIFEPMIAKDIEKKFFYSEIAKELGFTALRTGLAKLNCPYDNDYVNKNFSLNMLKPNEEKSTLFNTYMKKMILSKSPLTYRNLGFTYVAPDPITISKIAGICDNFGIQYNIIDPSNSNSIGMNPFVYEDVSKTSLTITNVLKEFYYNGFNRSSEQIQTTREEIILQAVQNICILLKEVYPTINQGCLPNLEDVLKILSNFDLAEKMCRILESNSESAEKYEHVINYFKNNFYRNGKNRAESEKDLSYLATQLDGLLRMPGVRNTLCNRTSNVNMDDVLSQGQITLVCTRRGDLGATNHRTFGLFFLLSLQNAILRRPGNEESRIPHFLYIDEFPEFICPSIDTMFTMYRKYRVGPVISIQDLGQLEHNSGNINIRQSVTANCSNKIFTGNAGVDELEWWNAEFGKRRAWIYSTSMDMNKLEYDPKYSGVKWGWEDNFPVGKLQTLSVKNCAYKICGDDNRPNIGVGVCNFLSPKYNEKQKVKQYNFSKYTSGITDEERSHYKKNILNEDKSVFDHLDDYEEVDPIIESGNNIFNASEGTIFNFKKGKK